MEMQQRQKTSWGWMLCALLTPVTAMATSPAPAPTYAVEEWTHAGNCEQYRLSDYRVRGPRVERPLAQMSDGMLRILASLGASEADVEPLRLTNLCTSLQVEFESSSFAPPRAEPWNPNPAAPERRAFFVFNAMQSAQIRQSVTLEYYPRLISLEYSIYKEQEAELDPALATADELRYADVGDHCPLRLPQIKQLLQRAGYRMTVVNEAAPDEEMRPFDAGPLHQFERGNRRVHVSLQGPYAEQRRAPGQQCVGAIEVKVDLY